MTNPGPCADNMPEAKPLGENLLLPNGFYKNLNQLNESQIQFICYGIPRSGSTLVYQLVSSLFSRGVAKTHGYCRYPIRTVVSCRDFRDVTISMWRKCTPANNGRV